MHRFHLLFPPSDALLLPFGRLRVEARGNAREVYDKRRRRKNAKLRLHRSEPTSKLVATVLAEPTADWGKATNPVRLRSEDADRVNVVFRTPGRRGRDERRSWFRAELFARDALFRMLYSTVRWKT